MQLNLILQNNIMNNLLNYNEYKDVNEKEISILALGESTMAGVGVTYHKEGLAGTFAKEWAHLNRTSVSWSVYARSGYTAQKVQQKLIPKIEKSNFDTQNPFNSNGYVNVLLTHVQPNFSHLGIHQIAVPKTLQKMECGSCPTI